MQNRARMLLEVVREVRRAAPEVPLFVRVSATDWEPDGISLEDTQRVCVWLRGAGVDFIDVSTGGNAPHSEIPVAPGYQVGFAQGIRYASGLPVSAVGLITEPHQGEQILSQGDVDAVMIGRAALADPQWPLHAARLLSDARGRTPSTCSA